MDKHRETRRNVAACQLDDANTDWLEVNLQLPRKDLKHMRDPIFINHTTFLAAFALLASKP